MANKSETGVGTQLILAILILFVAWVVLKWVIGAVISVVVTVVVIGAILFVLSILLGNKRSD